MPTMLSIPIFVLSVQTHGIEIAAFAHYKMSFMDYKQMIILLKASQVTVYDEIQTTYIGL